MPSFQFMLENQALVLVKGRDSEEFLQGLVTADVARIHENTLVYTCFLTPQGKFLDDFFLFKHPLGIALEAPKARLAEIAKRLQLYKLKAEVALLPLKPAMSVLASSEKLEGADFSFLDPRHSGLGYRSYAGSAFAQESSGQATYEQLRIELGVPNGDLDLQRMQSTIFDNAMDRIGAIAWEKGCYMGQEITARMKYRGLKKWDLLPLKATGSNPEVGEAILQGEKTVGQITSTVGSYAMARVRMDAMTSSELAESPSLRLASGAFEWLALDYMQKSEYLGVPDNAGERDQ